MSTFMFKNTNIEYTPISNVFIDKFMPKARGEYIKVYLLGLRYCLSGEIGINSSSIATSLHLLESDVMNAWNYWNDEGVVRISKIDNMGNFSIEFLDLNAQNIDSNDKINLLSELKNTAIKDMMEDIQKLLARPLSNKEMTMYLSWLKDYDFTPELLLLLIQYSISKGKTDYRYIEKIAISWHDSKIKTVDDAQAFIKKHEDKWLKIKKILKYLGVQSNDVMKPQEQMIDKWLNVYKFSLEVIYKACDICFERLNKAEFKYIDGILNNWFTNDIKTLEDIEKKDKIKPNFKKNKYNGNNKNDSFNNYEQRSYDYEDLEKKLLGWDVDD
ncbi:MULTISPECIES: DnaD domain protein [Clostridium]|uniref:Replication initiation and membrane attachment n=2 Tax=Clostridium TaxID=1485 RepID=A0A151AM70_9CLOT|nr:MULTISPECIES: DnaD domain protein [Clostridium]KYH28745.1 replication initiation and membrane attachment [Clostridium colicanis DSM 13634]MBE6044927.1 DnaD domain protein [Clostridium thermopalmarium]PRR76958.1 Replication initiation and membrane attachment [Clostridium thermopalmarium DSM 5974]PVZ21233.1 DnaD/phage-associated family protein [Clostridium thermopalmarium DSM 5974]